MIKKRCAIYTRKSTDEGLDQSFNSLDAQREACAAYIVSQRHEGWILVPKAYDDGGFSGGSMERPALKHLLADIKSGLIDIVVVYKIDRLTRALADFAKMVEVFDAREVSFVSVTQQFNTPTSMGRLTLNVLLSFAQFEREVTAERIRDKIAASKKKGMWMGGHPPLGYDVCDKKLVINHPEAEQVRQLFEAYLILGSTKSLTRWAKENGVRTKARHDRDGRFRSGNRPFSRGNLHALLHYRAYIGEIAHKGAIYAGEHEAILPRDLWDSVQSKLVTLPNRRGQKSGQTPTLPLAGLVFDETGDRLTPVHANKQGQRYYYYISARLNQAELRDPSAWRLPASVLEQTVVSSILSLIEDNHQMQLILKTYSSGQSEHAHILEQFLSEGQQLAEKISSLDLMEQLQIISPIIDRVDLQTGQITIAIKIAGLLTHMEQVRVQLLNHMDAGESSGATAEATYAVIVPIALKRRGVETRIIINNGKELAAVATDQVLVRTVAKARLWFEDLKSGAVASINDIAIREHVPASEVSRQLPLAFLAPSIVSAILAGKQSPEITAKALLRMQDLPIAWNQQRDLLGF